MRNAAPLLALVLVALAVPAALAHPFPPENDWERPLLKDPVDDCAPDSGPASPTHDCRGSDDLGALDVSERHDDSQGDLVVFRLLMATGAAGTHDDVLTFTSGGATKTFTFHSTDDSHFSNGGGFLSVSDAVSLNDGTRFYITGTASLASVGKLGDTLTNFHVDAKIGGNVGDWMPGGCHNTAGSDCACNTNSCDSNYYSTPGYRLRGSTYYANLEVPPSAAVENGAETIIPITARNLLAHTEQTMSLGMAAADGVQARFHDATTGQYTDTYSVQLAGSESTSIHVSLTGTHAGAQGTLTLTMTTSLGGRSTALLPYTVAEAGAAPPPPDSSPTSKPGPVPGTALAAIGLLAAAAWVSRRA
jgi:hypothetical protein